MGVTWKRDGDRMCQAEDTTPEKPQGGKKPVCMEQGVECGWSPVDLRVRAEPDQNGSGWGLRSLSVMR